MNREKTLQIIRNRLDDPIAIYLFGSAASGAVHDSSDIDLAVLSREPIATETRWDLQQELAIALRCDVDLVDLRSASTVMRFQVVTTGDLLYDGDSQRRAEFEMVTLSMYARFNEERREILEQVRRDGRIYA
jgi:predicted nucleotidyltransferase